MTFAIDTTTLSFVSSLATSTGFKFGDNEIPVGTVDTEPYAIVSLVPGGSGYGSMASNMEMATVIYQIKIVGHTQAQCRKFQQKIHGALDTLWFSITGCLGPARIVIGGIVKEDDRTFVADDTVYMEITQ